MTDLLDIGGLVNLSAQERSQKLTESVRERVARAEGDPRSMRKAAEEFEAMVLSQMLAPMMNTIPTDGPFSGGHAEQMFRSLYTEELGKSVAQSGGLGIADVVYQQLTRVQEV